MPTSQQSLTNNLRMTRRTILRGAGTIGAAGAIVGLGPVSRIFSGTANAATSGATAVTDCTMINAGEIGPFFVDGQLERSDVRIDTATGTAIDGVPLKLTLTFNEGGCNAALVGARVDIWSANPEGVYSDEASENSTGHDYLRGYQITDSAGTVKFTTLYPGWYAGRTTHIHARIRTYSGSTVTSDFLTQYFFDATSQAAILTAYADDDKTGFQAQATDRVFQAEVAEGGANVLAISGNVTDGYTASYAGEINTSSSNTGTTDTTVSAKLLSAAATRVSRTKRHVTVKFHAGEQLTTKVLLVLNKKVVAQTAATSDAKGNHTVTFAINNSVGHGAAKAVVACKDASGNYRNLTAKVAIPR
jgi:protocatechuate 3,4-dioxygenase beta subunit